MHQLLVTLLNPFLIIIPWEMWRWQPELFPSTASLVSVSWEWAYSYIAWRLQEMYTVVIVSYSFTIRRVTRNILNLDLSAQIQCGILEMGSNLNMKSTYVPYILTLKVSSHSIFNGPAFHLWPIVCSSCEIFQFTMFQVLEHFRFITLTLWF